MGDDLGSSGAGVDVTGQTPRGAEAFRRAATSLRFQLEDDDSDDMRHIAASIGLDPAARQARIASDVDEWKLKADPRSHRASFLTTTNRPLLDMYLRGIGQRDPSLRLPPGRELLYQLVSARRSAEHVFRTHLLFTDAILDQSAVVEAEVMWDPETNEPEVVVTFDDDGRERLARVTSEHVGEKLAIVSSGEIVAAPIIEQPITGGKTSIYLGRGPDTRARQAAAEDLKDTLRAAAALRGGTIVAVATVEPIVGRGTVVALRASVAVLGGVLVLIAFGALLRRPRSA